MKLFSFQKHRWVIGILFLLAGSLAGWRLTRSGNEPGATPPTGAPMSSPLPNPPAPTANAATTVVTNAVSKPVPPSAVEAQKNTAPPTTYAAPPITYDALARSGTLVRQERRVFQPQSWEVDLRRALALPAGVVLERRSAVFHVPDFPYPNIRVDRVYRLDRSAAAAGLPRPANSPPRGAFPPSSSQTNSAASGTGVLDTGGGEAIWENAMVADHLMVQVQPGITEASLRTALPPGARLMHAVTDGGLYLVAIPSDAERNVERAMLVLNRLPGVIRFAEPDCLMVAADTTPDDPLFGSNTDTQQWHLGKVATPRAWDVIRRPPTPAAAGVAVVAVVDTGVDYTHPDLAANIWLNPGETGGGKETNGIDDDGNGLIDDWHGWNFANTDASHPMGNNDPKDDVGHGTHVAGIIGALGNNNVGGTGVCWEVKILPLRIMKKSGTGAVGTYSAAIAALEYIKKLNSTTRRVKVANHSWGGTGYSVGMLNAIDNAGESVDPVPTGLHSTYGKDTKTLFLTGPASELAKLKIGMAINGQGIPPNARVTIVTPPSPPETRHSLTFSDYTRTIGTDAPLTFSHPILPDPYGVVHVAAAGNSRTNNDRIPVYPASVASGFVVSVGATDKNDRISKWGAAGSNYGKLSVDLFAPGTGIWSTKLKLASESEYKYEARDGTSMAAPQVAGALALLRLWQPNLTETQARQILLAKVDKVPPDPVYPKEALDLNCASGGRLNVAKMLDTLYQPILLASDGSTARTGITTKALDGAAALAGKLAMSSRHAVALVDGKVFGWGAGWDGQLGGTTRDFLSTPVEVPNFDDVIMVAAGRSTSFALKADGTVWVWGANYDGQFGNGQKETDYSAPVYPVPQQIAGLSDIVWISASDSDCLAVKVDGTVLAWGMNATGALGDGTTNNRFTPFPISGLSDIVQASIGSYAGVALRKDGTVYVWGTRQTQSGFWNSLGDGLAAGPQPEPTIPHELTELNGMIQVAIGDNYGMALAEDGTVWHWGRFDQSGVSYTEFGSRIPEARTDVSRIVAIAAGPRHFFAQDGDGHLFAWGHGQSGKLGNGSEVDHLDAVPVFAPADDPITSVAGGLDATVAVTGDGKLLTWGRNGRLGNGKGEYSGSAYPVRLPSNTSFAELGIGAQLKYAVGTDGTLHKWGSESYQNENEQRTQRPTAVAGMANVAHAIVGGADRTFIVKADGTVWSWGPNVKGELGLGDTTARFTPEQIGGLPAVTQVAAAKVINFNNPFAENPWVHVLAVTQGGAVFAWGWNSYGQLGDGTTTDRYAPVGVSGLSGITMVAAGMNHSLALKADGTVWAWGRNQVGQLGNDSTADSAVPVLVAGVSGVSKVGARGNYSYAVTSDGHVYAWGYAEPEQPAFDVIHTEKHTPQLVTNLPPVIDVASGEYAMLALLPDHTVLAWGNDVRRLARDPDSVLPAATPAPVLGLTDVIQVDCPRFAYALKNDGSVWGWGWGYSDYGILGDNATWSNLPGYVIGFGALSGEQSSLSTASIGDSWLFQNFSGAELLNDSISGDGADPDGDGLSNLLEYALGLDPRLRNAGTDLPGIRTDVISGSLENASHSGSQVQLFGVPTADLIGGKRYLAFTVYRQAGIRPDVDYIVEVSADLVTWNSGDPYTVTVLDTAETLEVYSAASLDDVPSQFMRLRIQRK